MPPEAEKQKHMESEIREMMSALTHRLSHLQHVQKQPGSAQHDAGDGENDDDHGMKIITLAGTNIGATMRGKMDMDDQKANPEHNDGDSQEALGTYVNSNFQAVNNSIMLGGSYSTNDPGVHMDISEYLEHHDDHHNIGKSKGKKKDKETSKSHHHSEQSD